MAKLESTFKNMVCSLMIIAMVAAAALAGVYTLTKDTIKKQEEDKQQKAIMAVLPNEGKDAVVAAVPDTFKMTDPKGKEKELYVYNAFSATDSTFIGAAVKTTANGFGGKFELMVGFSAKGEIVNYDVLKHGETPGLGDKMGKWFKDQNKAGQCVLGRKPKYKEENGKKVGGLIVSKDFKAGDEEENKVDAITAATISSRAFLGAVNDAYMAFQNDEEVAAVSSASPHHE